MYMHKHTHTHTHHSRHRLPDCLGRSERISRFQVLLNLSSEYNITGDSWGYRDCFNAVVLQLFCITNNLHISMAPHIYSFSEVSELPVPLLGLSEMSRFRMSLDLVSRRLGTSAAGSMLFPWRSVGKHEGEQKHARFLLSIGTVTSNSYQVS